jgi:hypothetical protein
VLSTTELWRLLEAQAQEVAQQQQGNSSSACCGVKRMMIAGALNEEEASTGRCDNCECDEDNTPVAAESEVQSNDAAPPSSSNDTNVAAKSAVDAATAATAADTLVSLSVLEYLNSVSCDAPSGCDQVEAMFRSYSADGQVLVSAVESSSSSGGYAEYIFKYAAQQLFGVSLWEVPALPYRAGRNVDMTELDINYITAEVPSSTGSGTASSDGEVTGTAAPPTRKLKFARAYGFRNIQSVMLKLRRGMCDFDFIEVMACPSGCNNGGGQIRRAMDADAATGTSEVTSSYKETPTQSRERISEVEQVYHSSLAVRSPDDSPLVQYLVSTGVLKQSNATADSAASLDEHRSTSSESNDNSNNLAALQTLHTRYHAVPKLEVIAPLAAKW